MDESERTTIGDNSQLQTGNSQVSPAKDGAGGFEFRHQTPVTIAQDKMTAEERALIKPLRTYQSDAAEALRDQNASVATIHLAEQERRYERERERRRKPLDITRGRLVPKVSPIDKVAMTQTTITKPPAPIKTAPTKPEPAPPVATPPIPEPSPTPPSQPPPKPASKPNPYRLAEELARQPAENYSYVEEAPATRPKTSARFAVLASLFLVLAGAGTLLGIFYFGRDPGPAKPATVNTLISYDREIVLDLTNDNREGILSKLRTQLDAIEAPLSSIIYFNLTSSDTEVMTPISGQQFLEKINSDIPGSLRRSLGERFMAGAIVFDDVKPFFVFTTTSFEVAFPGLLDWEVSLARDFNSLFEAGLPKTLGLPTSATALTTNANRPRFVDVVLNNRDTRVLRNQDGATVLLYSFLDKNTIIITGSEASFKELLNKFLNAKLIR